MISLTKRFLYVHVPKTAGNATQTALVEFAEDQLFANPRQDGIQRFSLQNQYGTHKHSSLSEYLTALGPALFWNLTRFATVRNPWERAVSFYFSPHRNTTTWDRSAFVRTLYELQPMSWFLCLAEGQRIPPDTQAIDVLLRYESLDVDFQVLCGQLGIPQQPMPLRNVGKHHPYTHYYDAELIALVAARFADDIHQFGYHFP